VLATIAPVIASIAMWMLTSSPFALMFAALGPVTAVASLLDARIGSRRSAVRERRRFAADIARVRAQVDERHDAERAVLAAASPSAASLVERGVADPGRWHGSPEQRWQVVLGTGTVLSSLDLVGSAPGVALSREVEAAFADLAAYAGNLDRAPVCVDARLGIGIVGAPAIATALARAIAVQLARSLSPAQHRWSSPPAAAEPWMSALPHARAPSHPGAGDWFSIGITDPVDEAQPVASVAVAAHEDALPAPCGIIVRIDERGAVITHHPDGRDDRPIRLEVVAREQALEWALSIAEDAARRGIGPAESGVPEVARLAPLLRAYDPADRSLECEIALSATGPVTVDLVAHGPHAIIGGTTGSGKSELLISWVLAMAAAHPPERVTFLLVDFKGGSAFGGLATLPHSVGIITDLDAAQAHRALESLRAELRYRERTLVSHGARSVDDVEGLPRLVIVVDEFAAMMAEYPELHALFADLAARGRSLGVHLILCTQRPSGVVRDAVLANADLRISLRVNNRADSSAVIGTDGAAAIPASARGRGLIAHSGQPPVTVQFAIADGADAEEVAGTRAASEPPRRPWCEPLPHVVSLPADVNRQAERGIAFGLLDLPSEQRLDIARWDPGTDGHMLVLGAGGSGCSTALAALGPDEIVPPNVPAAWDALEDLIRQREAPSRERIVQLDDADSLLARFPPDYRAAFVERLCRVLRDGPAKGIRFVLGAQRITADLQPIAALARARLFLRHSSRQEFVLAGGDGRDYLEGLPPGGGLWRGDRVQVAAVVVPDRPPVAARVAELDPARSLAVATTRPAAIAARLRAAGLTVRELAGADPRELAVSSAANRSAIVGDVDEWQSRWGALAALRPVSEVILDGCGIADVRALTRSRELPPPLDGDPALCWRLDENGALGRVRLPG
jgi:S-DNA-T family DNA segregation ATPase FtsK/SpoIIIE